ncbi:MAG: zinc-binding dehydrogenase [Planctomycetes bacterium]|nr:zinc-binding dehydrogenase [Planctomycetota bacterium]
MRTLASAFNQMDLWVGRGVPGLELTYPRVSGCDACGMVEAVGGGVDEAWIGRRVIFNAAVAQVERGGPGDATGAARTPIYQLIGEHRNGAHAERFLAPADNIADVGETDPIEAAAYGLCFLTAWSGMVGKGQLRAGQRVLVTGIGGGVATSALAIALHFGCAIAVTSRHEWKLERAKELGADLGVLDAGQDWSRQVRAWTNGRGVDMAMDSSGTATHLNCIRSLGRGGAYICPGATSGAEATTDLVRLFWNQLRVLGTTMGTNDEFREVVALLRAGKLRPVVDEVFTPERCVEAYERLEAGEQFGKVVLRWGEGGQ